MIPAERKPPPNSAWVVLSDRNSSSPDLRSSLGFIQPSSKSIMPTERELAISPIVQESVQHNTQVYSFPISHFQVMQSLILSPQVISNIRSLTASLFGVASGILGLESYSGFLFYLLGTFFVSVLIWSILAKGKQGDYFQGAWSELWAGDVLNGGMSFVLTWTLFYGLVRA